MAHTGLALAISLAAWANAGLLYLALRREDIYSPESGWMLFLGRVFIAVAAMSAALMALDPGADWWLMQTLWMRTQQLTVMVVAGGLSYFVMLLLLGLRPQQLLLRPSVSVCDDN